MPANPVTGCPPPRFSAWSLYFLLALSRVCVYWVGLLCRRLPPPTGTSDSNELSADWVQGWDESSAVLFLFLSLTFLPSLINDRFEPSQLFFWRWHSECQRAKAFHHRRTSPSLPNCQHDEGVPAVPHRAGQKAQDTTQGLTNKWRAFRLSSCVMLLLLQLLCVAANVHLKLNQKLINSSIAHLL